MEKNKKIAISNEDLVKFLEDLGVLMEMGVPVGEALAAIKKDFEDPSVKSNFLEVLNKIRDPKNLPKTNITNNIEEMYKMCLSSICAKVANFPPFVIEFLRFYATTPTEKFGKGLRHLAGILRRRIKEETMKHEKARTPYI